MFTCNDMPLLEQSDYPLYELKEAIAEGEQSGIVEDFYADRHLEKLKSIDNLR